MKGAYRMFPLGLRLSHLALVRNARTFSKIEDGAGDSVLAGDETKRAISRKRVADYVAWYADFLDVHHRGEDEHIFPALRRASEGRSTDIAHLDRWVIEHRDIYRLGSELRQAARQLGEGSMGALRVLRDRSAELAALLAPHLAAEEEVLTPEHLPEMISEHELERAELAIPRAQGAGALRSATFLVHSLEPVEQRELLGETPWVFRKVVLSWLGKPTVWRYRALMPSPDVAL